MIVIKKSPTRGIHPSKFSEFPKDKLLESTHHHINDVYTGLMFFTEKLKEAGIQHDRDKIYNFGEFHKDFASGFTRNDWFLTHIKVNRHHLNELGGIPEDVNLIDVLDFITDCVMAGMSRSGSVYPLKLSPELLEKAFQNTVDLLKSEVKVVD